MRDLAQVPEEIRGAVRNNGGGHSNHTMFWNIMAPADRRRRRSADRRDRRADHRRLRRF